MARLCARPGCSTPAAATFNFDGLNRIVWINPLADAAGHGAGDLCAGHADDLRPPRKWELRDTRPARPKRLRGTPAPSRYRAPAGNQHPGVDEPARPAAGPDRRPSPARPAAALAPTARRGPGGEAPASTPLLARAFRGAAPA